MASPVGVPAFKEEQLETGPMPSGLAFRAYCMEPVQLFNCSSPSASNGAWRFFGSSA